MKITRIATLVVALAAFLAACSSSGGSDVTKDAAVDSRIAAEVEVASPETVPELPDVVPDEVPADLPEDVEPEDAEPDDAVPDETGGPDVCVPSCLGVQCGDDGCGGTCGECGGLEKCDAGTCVCANAACGTTCCEVAEVCFADECCLPSCEGKVCGTDGCGGSCGECGEGYECQALDAGAACAAVCADLCAGLACGTAGNSGECDCGTCEDGNPCTTDGCSEEHQCVFENNTEPCDDGNMCTEGDVCGSGTCSGTLLPLEQLKDLDCLCQADADCVALEDGDICNGTLVCDTGAGSPVCDVDAATVLFCDDGVGCTQDGCDPLLGCGHVPVDASCDDGNVCTTDVCDALLGCVSTAVPDGAVCGAGGPWQCVAGKCTCVPQCAGKECGPDQCGGACGACAAGCECSAAICVGFCAACTPDCAAQNCGPDGCGGSCGSCAGGTFCDGGTFTCKSGKCTYPKTFPGTGLKINFLKAGVSGKAGEAVDVDENAATCAPKNDCAEGRDNEFAAVMKSLAVALQGSQPLVAAVDSGELIMLYEFVNPVSDGKPFLLKMYRGQAVLPKDQCDFQAQTCDYKVLPESFYADSCLPISYFDNAEMAGGKLVAGGPGYHFAFPFVLGLAEGKSITFIATHGKVVADVTLDAGGNVVAMTGVIGCAVAKSDILTIVDQIPEENLPFPKAIIEQLLSSVVKPDIDADGDGVKESVSSGMKFTAIPGNLTGMAP